VRAIGAFGRTAKAKDSVQSRTLSPLLSPPVGNKSIFK
jgi:hypothetical protein